MKEYKCIYSDTAQCPVYDGIHKGCPYSNPKENCFYINNHDSYIYLGDGMYIKDDFLEEEQ